MPVLKYFRQKAIKKKLLKESEVFCMAPWVHQYMFPDGKVFPCCISANDLDDVLGHLGNGDTLEEIWNNAPTKKLRKNMLNGVKSNICEGCYRYQALGKKSSREEFNEMFGNHIDLVENTRKDGSLENFDLKFIDFRFSNICNLRCRTCSHHFSNKWFEESRLLGCGTGAGHSLIYPVKSIHELWEQIEPILQGLERVHFAGGEPLMMEEHYKILNYLIEHGKTDVILTYNTNFADFRYKQYDVVDLWKHFRQVSLLASLDAMGERGEYMRKGLDWNKAEANRKRILKEVPHVRFQLTPTVSILNVLHLPDFYIDWLEKGLIQPREINIYLLFEPDFYNILHLPPALKLRVRDKYKWFLEEYILKLTEADQQYLRDQFTTVLLQLNKEPELMPPGYYNNHTFATYNGLLDQNRNENFRDIFPELQELND